MIVLAETGDVAGNVFASLRDALSGIPAWTWFALLSTGLIFPLLTRSRTPDTSDGTTGSGTRKTCTGAQTGLALALFGAGGAYLYNPELTLRVGVAVAIPALVITAWWWIRKTADRRHHNKTVIPLAKALAPQLPGWDTTRTLAALTVPRNPTKTTPIRIELPDEWIGTDTQKADITGLINRRLHGQWHPRWHLEESPFHVLYAPKPKRSPLPTMVEWKSSADPHTIHIGQGHRGDIHVKAETETPHWGIAAGTGSGKTTTLLIPIIHYRQHGLLIDIIDLKEDSYDTSCEGISGVRIHRTAAEAVAALAEFYTSMKAIRTAQAHGYTDPISGRILVMDEFGSFASAAKSWWQQRGKGTPPFTAWFHMSLMQGRTKNHRIVLGAHQFSLDVFNGSSDARDLVGTKVVVGECSDSKWVTSFGRGMPRPDWDHTIPGRGVIGITGQAASMEELQICFFTPQQARTMLQACPPAPAWFDSRAIAPWITPEAIELADEEMRVSDFLPGGQHAPRRALPRQGLQLTHTPPAFGSQPDRDITDWIDNLHDAPTEELPRVVDTHAEHHDQELAEPTPEPVSLYTLKEATEAGIVPLSYDSLRQRKARAAKNGTPFPTGENVSGITRYTADELTVWWTSQQTG